MFSSLDPISVPVASYAWIEVPMTPTIGHSGVPSSSHCGAGLDIAVLSTPTATPTLHFHVHPVPATLTNGPHTKQKSPEDKDDNVVQLLGASISAINTTKDLVPINLAKGILATIVNILAIAQAVIKNKSDFQAIADKCETIRDILERATKGVTNDDLPEYLEHALTQLNKSVNCINSDVESSKEQRFWHRLLSITINHDRITRWEKDLSEVLMLFRTEAIAGIMIRVEKLTLGPRDNTRGINDTQHRPPAPPSRPPMFYGRGDLIAELTNLVVNDKHIALIGPGGMGKSSLAKTILHEPVITKRFANRRYFVTYDGMDPLTITFKAFTTRFAEALGIELSRANPVQQIYTCLCSASTLVVLDNAETFEEAGRMSVLTEIPQAIAEIAGIPGIILILTSCSRRSALNVPWITKDIPPLDANSAQEAFFRIYHLATRENAEAGIANLLQDLEYHPLSINLLANAAQQNSWSPAVLLERWKDRHSAVLVVMFQPGLAQKPRLWPGFRWPGLSEITGRAKALENGLALAQPGLSRGLSMRMGRQM
ncbi:hypothetical protein F4604DRAFT_2008995 [Suillus subluteus]|nr:hypothetical protein F4604DRAFT_2008995 [Suillus subluteus]